MARRKSVYPLKTCLPSRNPYTPAKTWLARNNRTKTWLTNVKTSLSTKNVPRKGGSFLPRETTQARRKSANRAKIRLPSENVARKWRKGVLRGKTCLPKAETRLHSSQRRKRVYRTKPQCRSENVARKVSNAFIGRTCTSESPKTERKHRSQTPNRFTELRLFCNIMRLGLGMGVW